MTVEVWHYTDLYRPRWVWQVMDADSGCIHWGTMPTRAEAEQRGEEMRLRVLAG